MVLPYINMENGIGTCVISYKKWISSPGSMQDTGCLGLMHWNWCFWTVVLEKTLESPLDCKEIQPVHSKGDLSWMFIGGLMLKVKLQYFGHLMWRVDSLEKTLMLGGFGSGGEGTTEDEMAGWHQQLNGCEFEWNLGVGNWQGGLACCNSWGHRVGHEWVTELNLPLYWSTNFFRYIHLWFKKAENRL